MEIGKTLNTILTLIGGISWTIVYILIIIRSFRDKTYGMPFWALAFNFGWELIFSFVLPGDSPGLQGIINKIWLAFDVFILIAYFLYGIKEWPQRISKNLFYPYSLFGLIIGYLFVYLMSVELDHSQGMYAAFVQNLMMSLLFIAMANNRKSRAGQSIGIAIFKMIGTLAPTILYGVKSNFVLFLGCSCFVVDIIYIFLLLFVYKRTDIKTSKYSFLA
ncbi:hypothetical protein [Segetibacter koreensis]|uniref:transmembrane-type terpene cyclase n=1 Tax=Segetibacter koreensis TaxID=398037 RepID=UPI000375F241|nr:hypothetical protein [Segetibacter koreensis]